MNYQPLTHFGRVIATVLICGCLLVTIVACTPSANPPLSDQPVIEDILDTAERQAEQNLEAASDKIINTLQGIGEEAKVQLQETVDAVETSLDTAADQASDAVKAQLTETKANLTEAAREQMEQMVEIGERSSESVLNTLEEGLDADSATNMMESVETIGKRAIEQSVDTVESALNSSTADKVFEVIDQAIGNTERSVKQTFEQIEDRLTETGEATATAIPEASEGT